MPQHRKKRPSSEKHAKASESLQLAAAQWQATFDALADSVALLDAESRFVRINRATSEILGKPAEEILGGKCWEVIHGTSERVEGCPFEKMRASRQRESMILPMGERVLRVTVDPVFDGSGALAGAVHVLADVTEQTRINELLKTSEQRLQSIFRAAPVGIGLVVNRVIMQANEELCRMTGYSAEEMLGKNARFLYPTDDDYEFVGREKYEQIRKYGTGTVETRWKRKNGEIRDILLSSTPLDLADLSAGVTFTAVDLTPLRRARAERDRLFELSLDMLCVAGMDGYFRVINPSWSRTLGWSIEELLSKPWLEFVHPDDRPKTEKAGAELAAGQPVFHFENRFRCSDGSYRWLSWSSAPVQPEGLIFAVAHDVTEQKANAEKLAVMNDQLRAANQQLAASQQQLRAANQQLRANEQQLRAANQQLQASEQQLRAANQQLAAHAQQLRESESRFRSIIENTPVGMYMYRLEADGRLVFTGANPAADTILGISNAQFIGKTIEEAFPPLAQTEVPRRYREAAAAGTVWRTEQITYKDNQISGAFEVTAFQTTPGAMAAMFQDVTSRKQAETLNGRIRDLALALSAATDLKSGLSLCLDAAIEAAGMDCGGVYLVDEESGALDLCLSRGLSEDFVRAVAHYDAASKNARMVAAGKPVYAAYADPAFDIDKVRRHEGLKGIAVVPVMHRSAAIGVINVASHSTGAVPPASRVALETIAAHIADSIVRLRTQEMLRREHALVNGITEASPVGIVVVDKDGRVSFANAAAERLMGLTRSEAAGRMYNDPQWKITTLEGAAFADDDLPFRRIMRTKKPVFDVRHAIEWADGRRVSLSINAAPLFGANSEIEGVVATLQDISQQLKAEEDLRNRQRLESLGVLAGGIAHDFNNLLGGLFGYVDMVRHYCTIDAAARDYLDRAMEAFHRAKSLTGQLLTFSKGGMPFKKTVNIERIIREAAGLAISGTNVGCAFNIADDLPAVEADEGQIHQVINNIVINGRQAMAGGGTIHITAGPRRIGPGDNLPLPSGLFVEISIRDTGIGIPAQHLSKIFDPFFTTKQQGSGLGLAISYSIISKHGGHIAVQSAPGFGSTFTIYLPATLPQGAPEPGEHENPAVTMLPHSSGRILVMDDEPLMREMAMEMLQSLGYDTEGCVSGEEAIEKYRAAMAAGKRFNAVILDLTVPAGMGGAEAMKRIREIDTGAVGVVSSGYADDPVMADFKRYGFAAAVAKPYRIYDLGAVLREIVEKTGGN